MNFFQADIRHFLQMIQGEGHSPIGVAVIQYPLYQIRADVEEIADESTQQLDLFILRFIQCWLRANTQEISLMLGISKNIIRSRMRELSKGEYIRWHNEKYMTTRKGEDLLLSENSILKREGHREFLIDGISLKPTAVIESGTTSRSTIIHTILSQRRFEVYEESVRGTDFRPDVVHTPPNDSIVDSILAVPLERRKELGIPLGLLDIARYEPVMCTHPIAIVLQQDSAGVVHRRIYDCCGPRARRMDEALLDENFLQSVGRLSLMLSDHKNSGRIRASHSWHYASDDAIQASRSWDITLIKQIIREQWEIKSNAEINIERDSVKIVWKVSIQSLNALSGAKSVRDLVSKIHERIWWIHQHESSGVWLLFVHLTAADKETQELVDLFTLALSNNLDEISAMERWSPKELRYMLIQLEEHALREKIDTRLFLHPIQSTQRGES